MNRLFKLLLKSANVLRYTLTDCSQTFCQLDGKNKTFTATVKIYLTPKPRLRSLRRRVADNDFRCDSPAPSAAETTCQSCVVHPSRLWFIRQSAVREEKIEGWLWGEGKLWFQVFLMKCVTLECVCKSHGDTRPPLNRLKRAGKDWSFLCVWVFERTAADLFQFSSIESRLKRCVSDRRWSGQWAASSVRYEELSHFSL